MSAELEHSRAIEGLLQGYLKVPTEERTHELYEKLVRQLLAAGRDYNRASTRERLQTQRQAQRKGW